MHAPPMTAICVGLGLTLAVHALAPPVAAAPASLESRLAGARQNAEQTWGTGPQDAKQALQDILVTANAQGRQAIEAAARIELARLAARSFNGPSALAHLAVANELLGDAASALEKATLAQARGEVLTALARPPEARRAAVQALQLADGRSGSEPLRAAAHVTLATLDTRQGDLDAAVVHWDAASTLLHGLGRPRRARQADLEAAKLLHRLGNYREATARLRPLARQPLARQPLEPDNRRAVSDYLQDLFEPSADVMAAGNGFFASLASGDFDPADLPDMAARGGAQRPQMPDDRSYQRHLQRFTAQAADADSRRAWPPQPYRRRPLPVSPAIEERLVKECADVYGNLDRDDQDIAAWLEHNVPGFGWARQCNEEFTRSGGRLAAECPPLSVLFHVNLWDVGAVVPEQCGTWRQPFSASKIRRQYGAFAVVDLPAGGAPQSMHGPYLAMFEAFQALNPYGAHLRAVEQRHRSALDLLFDITLDIEVWNALGQAYQAFSPETGEAAAAFEQTWRTVESIWQGLPESLEFPPEGLALLRRNGLSINNFQRRSGPWSSLHWGSILFDAGRLTLWQGMVQQAQGRHRLAAAFFARCLDMQLATAAHLANPELELAARTGLAESFRAMGRPALAALALQTAVELADNLRQRLRADGSAISFADLQSIHYRRLVDLLIELGDDELAFAYAERARARIFLEGLGQGAEAPSADSPVPLSLPFLRDHVVADDTSLIVYFVTPTRLVAWLIEAGDARFFELAASPDALQPIDGLRDAIQAGDDAATAVLEDLHTVLVAPLADHIHHDRLLIVPHEVLHQVPFAALRDAADRTYWIEHRTLTLLPSPSALPWVRQHRDATGHRALVLGDPSGNLPAAVTEAQAVAALYGGSAHLGEAAREALIYARAGEIDVLHLAAHGNIDPANPQASHLLLAPGDTHDGRLKLPEIGRNIRLPEANLVVLSACDSGRGGRGGADDVLSLPWAFLHAGAPSVVSTLWAVEDAASATLMQRFHGLLRQGRSVDDALRGAQLDALAQEATAAPYFWAGYTLTGDPLAWGTPPKAVAPPPAPEPQPVADRVTASKRGQRGPFERRGDPSRTRRGTLPHMQPSQGPGQSQGSASIQLKLPWGNPSKDGARERQPLDARGAASEPTQPVDIGSGARRGLTLFLHGDFEGDSEHFDGDVPDLGQSRLGNDQASSLRLSPGCTATLFRHAHYGGRSTLVEGDIASLKRTKVGNDAVSSLKVNCP